MGGVGIVFLQAPDKSLFVKSLVEGSGASHSGIKLGDCLMKVLSAVEFEFVIPSIAQTADAVGDNIADNTVRLLLIEKLAGRWCERVL